MSITAYTGVMGSGKTYEVVREVVIPAIATGRRVVTNITGLDIEKIRAFILDNSKQALDVESLGTISSVDADAISATDFFPNANKAGFVSGGDLVVIDEAWRFWGTGQKIVQAHLEFWRMHRHYVHADTGIACDLVVISQDITDLHRSLKTVIELSFRAKKLKTLGMNNKYTVEMWEGSKQSRKGIKSNVRNYDKSVFPLYQSYSGATKTPGLEMSVDKRQNIFGSTSFKIGFVFAAVVLVTSLWYAVGFFTPSSRAATPNAPTVQATSTQTQAPPPAAVPTTPPANDNGLVREARRIPPISSEWRLAGFVAVANRRVVLLVNNAGRVRFESPGAFSFEDGRPISGLVDGQRVTAWSGTLSPASADPIGKSVFGANEAVQ